MQESICCCGCIRCNSYLPDAITWTQRVSGNTFLLGVSYGNGKYVVTGYSGTILTSSDGVTWNSQTSSVSNKLDNGVWQWNLCRNWRWGYFY